MDDLGEIEAVWRCLAERHIAKAFPNKPWGCVHDWLIAIMLRHCGYSQEQVRAALLALSTTNESETHGLSLERVHTRTAELAFEQTGTKSLRRCWSYQKRWRRDASEAIAAYHLARLQSSAESK